ncbi:hypothetical protein QIA19_00135 (plasmid) [Borreliella finlandensis]|uniref:hypothetical protein n=1 Tax=Borreliella finlandensis TaxID=498741 RepID=UPI0026492190|nr:hypothetical protein [Borreliella finlandensis]WKC89471.1 hypothetical protein QIA19_00135 [Borreliella finlandensis]
MEIFYEFEKIKYDEFCSDFMFVNFLKKSKLVIKPYYIELGLLKNQQRVFVY